jgi:hypothetical protein
MCAGKWRLLSAYNLLIINILEIIRRWEMRICGNINHEWRFLCGNITHVDVELFDFLMQVGTIDF